MRNITESIRYIVMLEKEELDILFEGIGPNLDIVDYYKSEYNGDFYFTEIEVCLGEDFNNIESIYKYTNAVAIHEEGTSGVMLSSSNISKVNDVFGWKGAGVCFLYSMLTSDEREELLCMALKKKAPFLGTDGIFIKEKQRASSIDGKIIPSIKEDFWEQADLVSDGVTLFNDTDYECFIYTGEKILSIGTGGDDISTIMIDSEIICYIFEEEEEDSTSIEILEPKESYNKNKIYDKTIDKVDGQLELLERWKAYGDEFGN